jgi:hypothetical protein
LRPIIIAFRVTEVEKKLIERKTRRLGCGSWSDFIRLAIRLAEGHKTDPAGNKPNQDAQ